MTHAEDAILKRWQQLREQSIAPRERLNDPKIIELEKELEAIRRELAPIRACIDRRS